MELTWPESVSSNRQRVMEELVQGRNMANQLRGVLRSDVRSAEGLVTEILGSLTNTLLILNGSSQEPKEELISQVQATSNTSSVTASGSGSAATAGPDSSSWDLVHDDAVKSEDSSEQSCKSTTETFKDRRGSYKRRKTSHSWTKDTLDLVDDGHAWRKYGQKMILNTEHPRNYFRCTHKFDHGCKATKHVQMIRNEPQLFRTTYIGNHTCTNYLRSPELILDCSSHQDDSSQSMIRFDSTENDLTCKQEHPFFSALTSIKKESVKEEEVIEPIIDQDQVTYHNQSSPSSDYLMSLGVGVFESSNERISEFCSTVVCDHDDVISRIMVGQYDNEVDFSYEF